MQHMKTVKEKEYETIAYLTCDLCGIKSQSSYYWNGQGNVNETKIEWRTGDSWPEGGSGELIKIDICPDCFKNKLIPWLESQGAKINKSEWDH
jgi:hypothetical protein